MTNGMYNCNIQRRKVGFCWGSTRVRFFCSQICIGVAGGAKRRYKTRPGSRDYPRGLGSSKREGKKSTCLAKPNGANAKVRDHVRQCEGSGLGVRCDKKKARGMGRDKNRKEKL